PVMKFVALISGGKDSCYNVMECVRLGHELVAIANLHPPVGDELNSYMYQTVGHDAIPYLAECFDVPLYRRPIAGTALSTDMQYTQSVGDETEDLYELLKVVLTHQPDILGVSVGAILSNYQRIRVEDVCERLNLTSLAYLWERDQLLLLDSMISNHLEAVLVKVAAIGLEKHHLGRSLGQMRPDLLKLYHQYGLHPCGEGGEYETLVLDCPLFLTKRLVLESYVIEEESGGVFYISSPVITTESKLAAATLEHSDIDQAPAGDTIAPDALDTAVPIGSNRAFIDPISSKGPYCVTVSGNTFESLARELPDPSIKRPVSVLLQLRDMSEFVNINEKYASFFKGSLPPARACIQNPVDSTSEISLTIKYATSGSPVQGLHVRSYSHWAPANIGPYSQGIVDSNLVHLSGQIPLQPETGHLS
ncbi:hypothetical protein CANCADRAFT_14390, partial [Tortispora caseinolytica NRRL Y-17796]